MDQNLISINIVAYNAEKTLARTLESVALQKDVLMEVIFINDASIDSTLQIAQDFKIKNPQIPFSIFTNEVNLGITKSRNKALEKSNGNYIAVLDSDDVWIDQYKLFKQHAFLIQNSEYVLVGTQMNIINSSGSILKTTHYKTDDSDIRKKMLIVNQFGHSSVLMRKPKTIYDESLYIWEDYDLFLKLGLESKIANLPDIMVNYVYVPKKYSFSKKIKLITTEIQIIKRYRTHYSNFWIGYLKGILKYILLFLHLK